MRDKWGGSWADSWGTSWSGEDVVIFPKTITGNARDDTDLAAGAAVPSWSGNARDDTDLTATAEV